MTNQHQTDSTNPTSHKRQRKTKNSASRAAQSGQQVGLAQRPAEVIGSQAADEWAVPEALLHGAQGVFGDGSVESQMARLDDPRLSTVQRRGLAAEIGRTQGNRHLQWVMATLKQGNRSQSTSGTNTGYREYDPRCS